MKSLVLNNSASITVTKAKLNIKNGLLTEQFKPNEIPYDIILLTKPSGFVSLEAIRMLNDKNKALVFIGYDGRIISHISQINQNTKMNQFNAYINKRQRTAYYILKEKFAASKRILNELGMSAPFEDINKSMTVKTMRSIEGKNADYYFRCINEYVAKNHAKWSFNKRTSEHNRPRYADTEFNAVLNYAYKLLEVWVRKCINSIGLDPYIGYVHECQDSKTALVYDLQELFRADIDKFVIDSLKSLDIKQDLFHTRDYRVRIKDTGIVKITALFDAFMTRQQKYETKNYQLSTIMHMKIAEFSRGL